MAVRMGIQPRCEINGERVTDLEANSNGVNKFYPSGPTCFYKGQKSHASAQVKTEAQCQTYLP
jgi:hypothetical protein